MRTVERKPSLKQPTGAARHPQAVHRNPEPTLGAFRPSVPNGAKVWRACACGGTCPRCERANVQQALHTASEPLDAATSAEFGRRFNHDFSNVRVHRDETAAESARAMQARAYTVGTDIVFGEGAWSPGTTAGRKLIAHELVHVVQQSRGPQSVNASSDLEVSTPEDPAEQEADRVADAAMELGGDVPPINATPLGLARTKLDVKGIDTMINDAAQPQSLLPGAFGAGFKLGQMLLPHILGHQQGSIAFAANYPGSKVPTPSKPGAPVTPVPKADSPTVPVDPTISIDAHFFPSGRFMSSERALILGGFHGDEHPGWEVAEAIVKELSAPAAGRRPLFFHTIVVPRVNAGAIEDELAGKKFWRNRCNRQVVDLNRNFPTGGTPADTDCANTVGAPTQPEVQGVMDLIRDFKPHRILSTHAISTPSEAGVFADPNVDPAAVELAHDMAVKLTDSSNRPFNRLTSTSFNPVYPLDKPGKVSGGTSLGAWGPTALGGNIPVITMEAPGFGTLAVTGVRSVASFLEPVREFLTDADDNILNDIDSFTAVERVAFLTGRLPLANTIFDRIQRRIKLAIAQLNALTPAPPVKVVPVSGLRLFSEGASTGSGQAQIVYNKFFLRGTPDVESFPTSFFVGGDRSKGVDSTKWLAAPSKDRLDIILKFSALPGASRHHWGTDVDFNSTSSSKWAATEKPPTLFNLGVWLRSNASKVGFVQAYTPGRSAGYNEEPWHFSYAPLAVGLRRRYNAQVNLSTDVADQFVADLKARAAKDGLKVPPDLDSAVKSLKIGDFVNTLGPGL